MDLTFRLPGPWGAGKGSNLQPTEVDNNFWALAEAIVDLQSDPAQPVGIASISVSGTQMTITLTDGSTMGPFTLPVLTFRWRGEWVPGAVYAELDVFTVFNVGIFMAVLDHTSGATFDPDIAVGGEPALQQLFGSADASLSALPDVNLVGLEINDFLSWDGTFWTNGALGTIVYQDADDVLITGGAITGMPPPVDPSDVATKAYVDALPGGATADPLTLMSNITGVPAPAIPNTLTDYLDAVLALPARGTLLYRGGPGWLPLSPGAEGLFLQTHDAGADPTWAPGGSGVTSITAGTGINTGAGPITASGTVSLAALSDDTFLANISGVSAAPTPTTLSMFLDSVLGTARGTVVTRAIGGWVSLSPGLVGQYLKSSGSGADLTWDSPVGSGTLTSITAGTGISTGGAPITSTGSVSLAAIANNSVLANTSGSSAAPVPMTVALLFDAVFGSTQGSVLYRNASTWVVLTPGTSGQILTTAGAAANPSWQNAPITGASIAHQRIVANISGSTAVPAANTLTNIFDSILGSSRGMILYRSNSAWVALAAGTSGQILQVGPAGDPRWITSAAAATQPKYVVATYVPGVMTANQSLLYHRFTKAVTLPANLGAYLGHTTVAGSGAVATGSTAIVLQQAVAATPTTFSTVATLTVAAGSANATMSTQAAILFAAGDVLRVRGPATADATLADFHLSLVGQET